MAVDLQSEGRICAHYHSALRPWGGTTMGRSSSHGSLTRSNILCENDGNGNFIAVSKFIEEN